MPKKPSIPGDLAEFRSHPGRVNQSFAPTAGHCGAGEDQIRRQVGRLTPAGAVGDERLSVTRDGYRLARQHRGVETELFRLDQAGVRADSIALLEEHHVARNELARAEAGPC